MYSLSQGPGAGWGTAGVLVPGIAGLVLLVLLCPYELARSSPMLDLRLLRERLFAACTRSSFVAFGAIIGILYVFTQVQQVALGRSPLETGLLTCPEALAVMAWTQVAARLYPRVGPRRLVAGGLCGLAAAAALLALQDGSTPLAVTALTMAGLGASIANVFLPLQAATFARMSNAAMGDATSMYNALRQAGSALGVAVLATVLATHGADAPAAGDVAPFHTAFLVAAGISLVGALLALAIRDADAASTMVKRAAPEPAVAEPVASLNT
jgi:MFS family permease